MPAHTFKQTSLLPASQTEAFNWHTRPGAFERLEPPWDPVEVVSRSGDGITDGARATVRLHVGPADLVPLTWEVEHRDYQPPRLFKDVQLSGPFKRWEHEHISEAETFGNDAETCRYTDRIEYELPLGKVGDVLGRRFARGNLEQVFHYRHRLVREDLLALHSSKVEPMTVAVTGSTGFIGSHLIPLLTTAGHRVVRIVRSEADEPGPLTERVVSWEPMEGRIDPRDLEGVDAVIHLAGESIFARWDEEKRRRIRVSRTAGTRAIAEAVASLDHKPKVFISASAIGIYGSRGDDILSEESERGEGFLADVAAEWEAAADPAREAGIRTVHPRIGVVLDPRGGGLAQMLPIFKLGGGGRLGRGDHWWSWITLEDTLGGIFHALTQPSVEGPMNLVAPHPVTNADFTKTLGKVLRRPTLIPVPEFVAKVAFGEMADEVLFGSQRVAPAKLEATGYRFRLPELEAALRAVLGRVTEPGDLPQMHTDAVG